MADLARALREARARAGSPTYRGLAKEAHRSASVLAAAASGGRCPTWEVTESFVDACRMDPAAFRELWAEADERDRADRRAARRRRQPKLATVRRLPSRNVRDSPVPRPARQSRRPDPWSAHTPAEYLHLLRRLRAWGGKPGVKEVSKHGGPGDWVTRATFYGALNPGRTSLPPLRVVRPLVRACGADLDEWVSAWRALSLREFDEANPPPVLPEGSIPLAGPDRGGTVRSLG